MGTFSTFFVVVNFLNSSFDLNAFYSLEQDLFAARALLENFVWTTLNVVFFKSRMFV